MVARTDEIALTFERWLDRFAVPASIKGKPDAIQDEAEALLRVLLRRAPASGVLDWLAETLESCEKAMRTRAWPTVAELTAACAKPGTQAGQDAWVLDSDAIWARRILNREPVGHSHLYGAAAVRLVEKGLVTDADLSDHRSSVFFVMQKIWGKDRALEIEAELRQKHLAAGGRAAWGFAQ